MADEEEFVIERIVDRRVTGDQKVEYLVKWSGFDDSDNTWELRHSLIHDMNGSNAIDLFESITGQHNNDNTNGNSITDRLVIKHMSSKAADTTTKSTAKRGRPPNTSADTNGHKKGSNKANKRSKTSGDDDNLSADDQPLKTNNDSNNGHKDKRDLRGFDRKLEADYICGATHRSGEVMFLVKWKGVNAADLVTAKEANVKIPQIVIKFYETNLCFK